MDHSFPMKQTNQRAFLAPKLAVLTLTMLAGTSSGQEASGDENQAVNGEVRGEETRDAEQPDQGDAESRAQPARPKGPNPYKPRFQIKAGSDFTLPADVRDTGGDVSVQRLFTDLGVTFPLSQSSSLSFGFEHESSFYTFDDTIGITPVDNDPIGYVQESQIKARFATQFNEEFGLATGGSLSIANEPGADVGESLIGRGFVATNYQVNDRLKLGLGVAVNSRLENNAVIVPVPSIEYRVSDRFVIATEDRGLGARYTLNDQVTLRSRAAIDFRQYRLDGGSAGLNDGVFQETAIQLGAGLDWQPSPRIGVGFDLGFMPYRELEFQNSDGVRIRRLNTDPSVSIGFTLTARF